MKKKERPPIASAPDCVVPWCERRVYQSNDQGLCEPHLDQWTFNIWQAGVVRAAQQAVMEKKRETEKEQESEKKPSGLWIPTG